MRLINIRLNTCLQQKLKTNKKNVSACHASAWPYTPPCSNSDWMTLLHIWKNCDGTESQRKHLIILSKGAFFHRFSLSLARPIICEWFSLEHITGSFGGTVRRWHLLCVSGLNLANHCRNFLRRYRMSAARWEIMPATILKAPIEIVKTLPKKMEIKLPFSDVMRINWCFMSVAQQQIALSTKFFLMAVIHGWNGRFFPRLSSVLAFCCGWDLGIVSVA